MIVSIIWSLLLSWVIGLERERQDKPAGLRTIMLVCFGATLAMLFAREIHSGSSIARIPSHFLAAIGFVGSGSIIVFNKRVEGITTAALLLPMTVVGFLCGIERYFLATVSAVCIYAILKLKRVRLVSKNKRRRLR